MQPQQGVGGPQFYSGNLLGRDVQQPGDIDAASRFGRDRIEFGLCRMLVEVTADVLHVVQLVDVGLHRRGELAMRS